MNYNDLTIVIPVRIDSPDRLRNIYAVTEQLKQLEGVKIIVLEADTVQRIEKKIDGVQKVFVEDANPLFFHTRYLNVLCSMVDTEFMGIWDCDVVAPREQIEAAMAMLGDHTHDMVFPYDGSCYNIHGELLDEFLQAKQIPVLQQKMPMMQRSYGRHTCGGAILVNRQAYIEAGGDNEKFRGWGPEDLERYKRWEVKGYRVARTGGAIFHLNHARGKNSYYYNKELKCSTIQALLETCQAEGDYADIYIPVYIINLADRTDRRDHILAQFEGRQEFAPILVEAYKDPVGAYGLWKSIVKAVKMAKENEDSVMILCEDDHLFTPQYSAQAFLRQLVSANEQGCDILMGGIGGFGAAVPTAYARFWVDWFWSTQFVVVYAHSFDKILNYEFKKGDTADGIFSQIFSRKMTIYPFISVQHDFGYSDVTRNNNRENEIENLFATASKRLQLIEQEYKAYH